MDLGLEPPSAQDEAEEAAERRAREERSLAATRLAIYQDAQAVERRARQAELERERQAAAVATRERHERERLAAERERLDAKQEQEARKRAIGSNTIQFALANISQPLVRTGVNWTQQARTEALWTQPNQPHGPTLHVERPTGIQGPPLPIAQISDRPLTSPEALIFSAFDYESVQKLGLSAQRALACTCTAFRALVRPHLFCPVMEMDASEGTWANVVFVVRRYPRVQRIRVRGEELLPEIDVDALRGRPGAGLRLASMDGKLKVGTTTALFLGAVIYDCQHRIRLTDNLTFARLSAPCTTLPPMSSPADFALFMGAISSWSGVVAVDCSGVRVPLVPFFAQLQLRAWDRVSCWQYGAG